MPVYDKIRLGLIGFGIGKVYAGAFRSVSNYYSSLPAVELVGVASAGKASVDAALERFPFARGTTDFHQILESPDINTVVIAVPNYLHAPILEAALQTDKAIYIDKPLANSLDEAQALLAIARQTGRDAQMIFELRFCPAIEQARRFLEAGRLGRLYAFRARYYRSSYIDPSKPLRWKRSTTLSGTGVLGDLGSHLIDLVTWLVGQPQSVSAQLRTFITQRPEGPEGSPLEVETDDHALLQLTLPDGVIGTIEASRLITGAQNDMEIEIYGSEGSLRWNLQDGNYLELSDRRWPEAERGWLKIPVNSRFPNAFAPGADVPAGMVRCHIASAAEFIRRTVQSQAYDPGLEQGVRVQSIIEAAVLSHRKGSRVAVSGVD